jgi:hypothetical protein
MVNHRYMSVRLVQLAMWSGEETPYCDCKNVLKDVLIIIKQMTEMNY